jgi:hypothetical protein
MITHIQSALEMDSTCHSHQFITRVIKINIHCLRRWAQLHERNVCGRIPCSMSNSNESIMQFLLWCHRYRQTLPFGWRFWQRKRYTTLYIT